MKNYILYILIISFLRIEAQKVIAIKDGDTIEILENNQTKTLRLAEIDCPEKGQPFGNQAKNYTSSLVFGKKISYKSIDTDQYGRTIAKVYINNQYLSELLIKKGLAWVYLKYSNNPNLLKAEKDAKKNKLGLWADANPIAPWNWRKK